jgi:hypothetical protein
MKTAAQRVFEDDHLRKCILRWKWKGFVENYHLETEEGYSLVGSMDFMLYWYQVYIFRWVEADRNHTQCVKSIFFEKRKEPRWWKEKWFSEDFTPCKD